MNRVRFKVEMINCNLDFYCYEGETILMGLERTGKDGTMIGCRQGGCGICRVQILSGEYIMSVMSCDHVTEDDKQNGIVLACRTIPTSDIKLNYLGLKV